MYHSFVQLVQAKKLKSFYIIALLAKAIFSIICQIIIQNTEFRATKRCNRHQKHKAIFFSLLNFKL